ncbi:MAG: nucleotidyltransferase family protein [Actinobacteria bacterium]|nr:nucleotidyltransferase family protein [Actinomycetota bacterium]MBM3712941.1 nucleotidyltransferase family protein [Actinomycetota bacterium]
MKNIEDIKKILNENKPLFRKSFKVKEIGIFGSYIKSEQTQKSDLDILVEFENPIDFFDYLEFEEYLTKLLEIKVDLVMKKALKPNIGEKILKEVIYV